jgi:DNA-binding CsgD family transcriptional regulator
VYILSFVPVQRPLTPRQHLILRSVARGMTNKDIAADLGISEQGVKVHISRLLERYGAANRVELISVTRAWAEVDERTYGGLSRDIAGIRSELNQTYKDATAFGRSREGNSHKPPAISSRETNGHSVAVDGDLSSEVRSLRDILAEINVALNLARELPADTSVGPLVDAIRARVTAALNKSARLEAVVAERRLADLRSRETAS